MTTGGMEIDVLEFYSRINFNATKTSYLRNSESATYACPNSQSPTGKMVSFTSSIMRSIRYTCSKNSRSRSIRRISVDRWPPLITKPPTYLIRSQTSLLLHLKTSLLCRARVKHACQGAQSSHAAWSVSRNYAGRVWIQADQHTRARAICRNLRTQN